jgi:hypothetical protein
MRRDIAMTGLLETVRWDMVAAGFQLVLCTVILGSWILRRAGKRSAASVAPAVAPPAFALEVMLQTVRQQTEHSLQCILSAVEAERDRLQQALACAGSLPPASEAEAVGPALALGGFRWGAAESDQSVTNRYAGLNGLAEQGLNPRQIADRMNLPAGEIELALKMRGAVTEGERGGEPRQ